MLTTTRENGMDLLDWLNHLAHELFGEAWHVPWVPWALAGAVLVAALLIAYAIALRERRNA